MISIVLGLLHTALYFYILLVIIWAIASTLVSFNILNAYDPMIRKAMMLMDRLVQPALRPIQKMMPNLGGLDLSPIILIMLLSFVQRLLGGVNDAHDVVIAIVELMSAIVTLYMWCVGILAVLGTLISFRLVNLYQPLVQTVMMVLRGLCDPAIRPIRKYIKPVGRLDIAPFVLFAAIYLLLDQLHRYVL